LVTFVLFTTLATFFIDFLAAARGFAADFLVAVFIGFLSVFFAIFFFMATIILPVCSRDLKSELSSRGINLNLEKL
jgi:hypothetical protein